LIGLKGNVLPCTKTRQGSSSPMSWMNCKQTLHAQDKAKLLDIQIDRYVSNIFEQANSLDKVKLLARQKNIRILKLAVR
jgi:hypothetical protein